LLLEESLATIKNIEGGGLTRRESQVLTWVRRGKTNREISILLSISPRTVQKHLEHIFQKLGVETRTAAAATGLSFSER
jgi:DNA-binding CsgD family transcriptional regulator